MTKRFHRVTALALFLVSAAHSLRLPMRDNEGRGLDPTPTTSWTALPTKEVCPATRAACYGVDVTWTVIRASATVQSTAPLSLTASSATSLAIVTQISTTDGNQQPVVATSTLWPLPEVSVTVGQRIRITLVNQIQSPPEEVTLHFHGVLMKNGFVSMDGPEMVTQCGLGTGTNVNTFIYDFPATEAGTYWIHSHDPGQYPKGIRGSLIITDDVTDIQLLKMGGTTVKYVDDFRPVTLSDWYLDFWTAESKYLSSPLDQKQYCTPGVEMSPDAVILNDYIPGVTQADTSGSANYLFSPSTTGGQTVNNRLRFINMSAYSQFLVRIFSHVTKTIEVDGILIESQKTDGFIIGPGQRVSVLVESLTNPISGSPYFIIAARDPSLGPEIPDRGRLCSMPGANQDPKQTLITWGCIYYGDDQSSVPNTVCGGQSPGDQETTGLLTYKHLGTKRDYHRMDFNSKQVYKLDVPWGSSTHTTLAYPWNFDEKTFRPLTKKYSADQLMNIKPGNIIWLEIKDMKRMVDPKDRGFGSMNQELWQAPSLPAFLTALKGSVSETDMYINGTYGRASNTIIVKDPTAPDTTDPVVWIVFQDSNGDHPMHLHGHHFHLLYKGAESDYSIGLYRQAVADFNGGRESSSLLWKRFRDGIKSQLELADGNPMSRDTLFTENYQFHVFAFVADNPGVWALHCHNDFHARSGMFKQIVERPASLRDYLGTWQGDGKTGFTYTDPMNPSWKVDPAVLAGWRRNLQHCATAESVF